MIGIHEVWKKSLEHLWPIQCVEHDLIVSRSGDYTACFKVLPPETGAQSTAELQTHHQAWVKAIKLLPKQTILYKQDWFVEQKWRADFEKSEASSLTRGSDLHFNERPCLEHEGYLFITRKAVDRKLASSLFSTLTRRSIVPQCTINHKAVIAFIDAVARFKSVLEGSGCMQLQTLGKRDLQFTYCCWLAGEILQADRG